MQATAKALPIVGILAGLSTRYGKKYCHPSQKKILELLADRLNMFISIATLNRYLRVLEDGGFIHRTRRITFHPVKGLLFRSTMYVVIKKGLDLLGKIGVSVYGKIRELTGFPRGKSKKKVAQAKPEPHKRPTVFGFPTHPNGWPLV